MNTADTQRSAHPDLRPSEPPPVVATVPLRHPWRWLSAAAVLLLALWWGRVLITTESFQWDVVGEYLFDPLILRGVRATLLMTAMCMALGCVLGTILAIMRLSSNFVLRSVAGIYIWFFRGTPTLVQLLFWFNLAAVFPRIEFDLFGLGFSESTNSLMTPMIATLLGLGLNFAAYYSEVVRSGILSVDEGQIEAATAYGISRARTLRHIVLPQAMRVIIPPTGNELIGMLKWTSVGLVVAYSELLHSASIIYSRTFQVIPLLVVASIWYLGMTTILTIGQHFVEKRFARGSTRHVQVSFLDRLRSGVFGVRRAR